MNIIFLGFCTILSVLTIQPYQNLPDKGVPYLVNFAPADYHHQGKIWAIDSAPNGIEYMASDKGLLEYDGNTWKKFKASAGIIRSVKVINDSLLYTGSDLDFGVWTRNEHNTFTYTSLYPFKEELAKLNEEFWKIYELDDYILFVSASNIYVYKNQNLTKVAAPSQITSSFMFDNTLFLVDEQSNLYELRELTPIKVSQLTSDFQLEVVGSFHNGTDLVLVSRSHGLFTYANGSIKPMNSRLSEELKKGKVFSLEFINDTHLAFGTVLKGLLISDMNGTILHYINKNKGLQNNTILSVHHSQDGKLWIGMDYGISSLDIGSNVTFIHDFEGSFGTGYTAVQRDDMFYLGTNQGLYSSKWEDLRNDSESNSFTLVKGTEGQVWTLKNIDGRIWMGHDKGLFVMEKSTLKKIDAKTGYWTIQPYKQFILAGSYNGISIFKKEGESWIFDKKMELILGSCNQVMIEGDRTLWVNIPNFGVIRAQLNEELSPEQREIFPLDQFNVDEVFLIEENGVVKIQTSTSEFIYDSETSTFNESPLERIKTHIHDVLLAGKIKPTVLNSEYEFYPIYNGFALKSLNVATDTKGFKPQFVFRSIEAFNNQERIEILNGAEISNKANNIRITGIVPNRDNAMYQFKLDRTIEWSDWSEKNSFELVGLGHGDHRIYARAMVGDSITESQFFDFTIETPWYLAWYAIVIYVCLFAFLIYVTFVWQKATLKALKEKLLLERQNSMREQTTKHLEELLHLEQKQLEDKFQQLTAQLKTKTIELATRAKETEKKNDILRTLKDKIEGIKNNPVSFQNRSAELQRLIDSCIKMEDNTFEIQMDELHQEFFVKLRDTYPQLSNNDLRLCAYIKTGFNSKELADLLNIQPSSVYISRSRLRKKLDLDTERDLHTFLNSI